MVDAPTPLPADAATQARAARAAGDRIAALRLCAAAMATDLQPADVEPLVEVLDEIRAGRRQA